MTSVTTSSQTANQSCAHAERKGSDAAPMTITRLSGWIDMGEAKTETCAWIIPTKIHVQGR